MGEVIEHLKLSWQALWAPTPEWEAAARQVQAREAARPKGHAASEVDEEEET